MSVHYLVQISTWLSPATPKEYLDELRWHCGLADRPAATTFSYGPELCPGPDQEELPGGATAVIRQQQRRSNRPAEWAVFVRMMTNDDHVTEGILPMVYWLGQHCSDIGRFGYAESEYSAEVVDSWPLPDFQFYAANGFGYIGTPTHPPSEVYFSPCQEIDSTQIPKYDPTQSPAR